MNIFIAGGTGTIGVPLVRALVASGHQVHALTRSPQKTDDIRSMGAVPAVADALDAVALTRAVLDAGPTHVIHQLTALPKEGPKRASDLAATNRLRSQGTKNLLDASIRAKYEKRFGVDLGHVRVITGEFAEEFNRKRDAYAVTVGSTGMILMGNSPEKAMGSRSGEALLAHELTHVAQAQRGLHNRGRSADFTQADEIEAHEVEHEVEEGFHPEGQGAANEAAQANMAAMASQKKEQEQLEKIKARVLEMMAEGARNQYLRNGITRRP